MPLLSYSQRMRRVAPWVFVCYTAVTLALTYPLVLHLADGVPNDVGDPLLNTWILWWNSRALPLTAAWWNAPAFFPAPDTLALSEHLLGLSVFTTPVIWLTGRPQLAYNLLFLGTFVLSGMGGYALGVTLTGRRAAGFVSGLVYAFAPHRMAQFPHIQVLASFWMPFALVGLHRYLQDGRLRWLVLFGAATLGQGLSNGYFLLFFPVLVGLWLLWFPPPGRRLRTVATIGATYAISALPLVPILLHYRAVHERLGLHRNLEEMTLFSADITDLWHASPVLSFWSRWLAAPGPEREVFPGLTVVVLIAAAAVWGCRTTTSARAFSRRSALAFYVGSAVVTWILCLGPSPSFAGTAIVPSYLAPYRWLVALPGFIGLRVPGRFAMLATLCLAGAAGVAVARLQPRLTRRGQVLLLSVVCAGVLVDGWRRTPVPRVPSLSIVTASDEAGAVLELPIGTVVPDTAAMYHGMAHRHPVVNGYSGYGLPHMPILIDGVRAGDHTVLEALAARGLRHVVVTVRWDPGGDWRTLVERYPGAALAGTSDALGQWHYVLPAPAAVWTTTETGPPLPIASVEASALPDQVPALLDGDRATRWTTGATQQGGEWLSIDLGAVQSISVVEMELGTSKYDAPNHLTIEASIDGGHWVQVWDGGKRVLALLGALDDPARRPLRATFPPIEARHVRLRQTGVERGFYWSVAELAVLGPAPGAASPDR